MTRLARTRRNRAELLTKSALYGALAGTLGLVGGSRALAGQAPSVVLPVQAPTTPQVAGGNVGQPLVTVTGNTMTVATNASRTLIDWNSFTVGTGNAVNFTMNTRSDIVLNRLVNSTPVIINGGLSATVGGNVGGNVWFSAPGGIVFGTGAAVNVGGMIATTALVDVNSFLNSNNTSSFPFTYPTTGYAGTTGYPAGTYFPSGTYPAGSAYPAITGAPVSNVAGGVGGVTVENGATITARGGLLALIAPFVNVAAGGRVQSLDESSPGGGGGAGSTLIGSANAFTVSLSQESSGDLDMLQFVVNSPSQVTDHPLLLQGTTAGTNVYVAALTASGITGAVVDATGTLTATTAASGAGGEIILSSNADTVTAPTLSAQGVYTPGSAVNASGGTFSPVDIAVGDATAGRDLQILGDGALNGAGGSGSTLSSGSDLTINTAGAIDVEDVASTGGGVNLTGASVTAGNLASSLDTEVTANTGAISLTSVNSDGGVTLQAPSGAVGVASTLDANGGGVSIIAGGDVTVGGSAFASTNFIVSALDGNGAGLGNISTADVTADGYVNLQGASVFTGALTGFGFDANGNSILVNAVDRASGSGGAFVDVASANGYGNFSLTAGDGYASLTSVNFESSGQTLNLASNFGGNVYLGYAQGGPNPNGGGPVGGVGTISGSGTINLTAQNDVDVDVASDAILNDISAFGAVNVTSTTGQISVAQDLFPAGDITMTAPGPIQLANVSSGQGAVTLTSGSNITFGTAFAGTNFTATSITGAPGSFSGPGTGTGTITADDIQTGGGYIDVEGTNVTVGNLSAGGTNPNNGDYIYAAAWGDQNASPGTLSFTSTNPNYVNNSQVFLYPAPPPPALLPVEDPDSPPQTDANGQAPTIATTPTTDTITLNAKRTLIDWTSYQISSNGEVDYIFNPVEGQNAANARGNIVLNRITGGGPVDIEGILTSSVAGDSQRFGGNVWFSAPGGILFGSAAVVNVGGMMATTAGFSVNNLQQQFLDPTVFTFSLDGTGSGYPSGGTGFPGGDGYPNNEAYPDSAGVGLQVAGGAQIHADGGLIALVAPYVQVGAGAQITNLDANGAGAGSVLYAAAPSYTLQASQPNLGGDVDNGIGDLDLASLTIGTNDLSGYATPLDLEGATTAENVYAASLTPGQVGGAAVNATGAITTLASATGAGGEVILSTIADTLVPGQTPLPTTGFASPVGLSVTNITAASDLQIAVGGGISADSDPGNLLSSAGNLTLTAGGDISLSTVDAGGGFTANATDNEGFTVGLGAITAGAVTANGAIDLEGSSVSVGSLSTTGSTGTGSVTANAYDPESSFGNAFVDIGSITAPGDINITALDGYASLTNVTFTGAGQTLNLTANGFYEPAAFLPSAAFLGYAQGGPTANGGSGPTAGVGSITGAGSINVSATGDVNVNLTGDAVLASATGANVYVTATGLAHVDSATSDGGPTDPIDITGASAYLGTGSSQDDIAVTATNGSATVGDVTAMGAVTVSATNGVASLHSAALTPGTSFPSGAPLPTPVSVTATGSGADAVIGGTDGLGFITGASSVSLQADEDATVNVNQPIELNLVQAGRNVSLTAPSLTLDALQGAITGDIGIDVTNDAFTYTTPLTAGGAVTASATGLLTLGDVTANGRAINLTGAGIGAGAVNASTDATLTSTGGDITLTGFAQAGGDFTIAAAENGAGVGAIAAADISAGGAINLQGSSVFTGALTANGVDGEGDSVIVATYDRLNSLAGGAFIDIGSITASGPVTLTANDGYASLTSLTETGGGVVGINAGGFDNATGQSSAIYLGYGQGGAAANGGAGPTPGVGFLAPNGATVNLTAAGPANVNVTGDAILGTVQGDGVSVTATGVASVADAVSTGGSSRGVTLMGSQATLPLASSQGDIDVTATDGAATVGDVTAQGAVSVTATNGVASLHSAALSPGTSFPSGAPLANTVSVTATGSGADAVIGGTDGLGFITGASSISLQADEDATVNVNQPIELNLVQAGRNVSLTAPSLTLDALQGAITGDIGIDVTNDAFTYTTALTAGGAVTASATGLLTLGDVTTQQGAVSLTGGGVSAGAITAATDATVTSTGGDITLSGNAMAGGSFTATALDSSGQGDGAISVANVNAVNAIDLEGSSIAGGALMGGGAITVRSVSDQFGDPTSGVDLASAVTTGGDIAVTSSFTTTDPATGAPLVVGTGPITVGTLNASGAVTVTGLSLVANDVTAGSTVDLEADSSPNNRSATSQIDVGTLAGAGAMTVNANNGYASIADLTLDGTAASLNLTASGAVYLGYTPGGAGVGGGTGTIAGAGSINLTGGGDVDVDVTGAADLASVNATSTVANLTADSLTVGLATGARGLNLTANTGDLSVGQAMVVFGDGAINATATQGNATVTYAAGPNIFVNAAQTAELDGGDNTRFSADSTTRVVDVTGATAILNGATSQNDVSVTATNGSATLASATAGGDITVGATNGSAAAGDVFASGNVRIGASDGVASVHSVTFTDPNDSAGHPNGQGLLAMTATGTGADVAIGGVDSFGDLGFVTGATSITAQADEDVTVNVAGPISLTTVQAGRNAVLTADDLAFGTLTAQQDVTLTAPNVASTQGGGGTITGDTVSAGEDLTVNAGGALSLASFSAGRNLSLIAPSVSLANLVGQPSGSLYIDATASGFTDTNLLSAAGPVTVIASGALTLGDVTSTNGVLSLVGDSLATADLNAGATINLTAVHSISAGDVTAGLGGAGNVVVVAGVLPTPSGVIDTSATASLGAASAQGLILISSPAAVSATSLTTYGANAGQILVGSVNGGALDGQGTYLTPMPATIDIGSAAAGGGDVTLQAIDSITAGALTASGGVTASENPSASTLYDNPAFIDIASTTSGGPVLLTAQQGYASLGSAAFTGTTGMLTVNAPAGNIYVGYQPGGQQQGGGGGTIATATTVDLNAGGDIDLDVAGAAVLDQAIAGGPGSSQPGSVFLSADALTAAYLQGSAATLVARTGDINVGAIDALNGKATVVSTHGNVTIAGDGSTATTAQGTSYVPGNVFGQGIAITGAGAVDVSLASTTEPLGEGYNPAISVDVTGAQVNVGTALAFGDVVISATNGDALASRLFGGTISVSAVGGSASLLNAGADTGAPNAPATLSLSATGSNADVFLGVGPDGQAGGLVGVSPDTFKSIDISADRDVHVQVSEPLELTSVQAGRDVSLSGPAITLDALGGALAGDVFIDSYNSDFSYGSALAAGGNVTVEAAGAVTLGAVTSTSGAIQLTSFGAAANGAPLGTDVTAGDLSAGGNLIDVVAEDGSATVHSATFSNGGGTLSITAAGAASDVNLGLGDGVVDGATEVDLQADRDVNVGVADPVGLTSVNAGRNVSLTAPALTLGALGGGLSGDVSIFATAGDFTDTGALTAGGAISVRGSNLTLGDATAGTTVALTALDSISAGALTGPTGVTVQAGAQPTVGASFDAGAGATLASATSGGDVLVSAPGAIQIGSLSSTATDVDAIDVAGLVLPTFDGASTYTTPVPTSISLDSATSSGGINLNASGAITAGSLAAANTITADTSPASTFQSGGSPVDIGTAEAGGAITLASGDGYASLGSVILDGTAASLSITGAGVYGDVYLGYQPGGQGQGGGTGSITGAGPIELNAGGALNVDVSGAANLDTTQAQGLTTLVADSIAANTVTDVGVQITGPGVEITALTGDVNIGTVKAFFGQVDVAAPAGDVTLQDAIGFGLGVNAHGLADVVTANSTELIDSGGVTYNQARPIQISGAQVTVGSAFSFGDVDLTASAGPVNIASLSTGGDGAVVATGGSVTLGSATQVQAPAGTVQPTGTLTLTANGAGADVLAGQGSGAISGFTTVDVSAGRDAILDLAGVADLDSVTAGRNASVTGDQITLSSLTAGQDASLSTPSAGFAATGGVTPFITAAALTAGRDLTVSAADAVTLGALSVGRNLSVTGSGVTLQALRGAISGDIAIDATASDFTSAADLTAGGAVTLTAAGALDLGNVTAQGGAVSLYGASIDAQGLTAATGVLADATAGDVMLQTATGGTFVNLAAEGSITAATLTAGSMASGAGSVDLRAGLATALGGPVDAMGSIDVGAITAGDAINIVSAPDAVVLGSAETSPNFQSRGWIHILGFTTGTTADPYSATATYTASNPLLIQVGHLSAGSQADLAAQTSITASGPISAGGDIELNGGELALGDVSSAAGSIGLSGAAIGAGELTALQNVDVVAGGALTLGGVSAGDTVMLTGRSLAIGAITGAVDGDVDLTATGGGLTDISPLTAGGGVSVAAAGPVSLGDVTAQTGTVLISSQGSAIVHDITAPGAITLTASGGSATLHSASFVGGAGVLAITATGTSSDVALGQGDGAVNGASQIALQAGRDIAVAVTGPIDLTSAQAGRDLAVTADGVSGGALGSGRDTVIKSGAGVGVTSIAVVEDLTVTANDGVAIGPSRVGRNLSVTGQTVALGGFASPLTGDVTIDVFGGDFGSLASPGGGGPITAAGDIDITASGAVQVATVTSTGGGVSLTGASVAGGAISAADAVDVAALSGNATFAPIVAGTDVNVSAARGDVALAGAVAGRDLTVAGLGVSLGGALTAGRNLFVGASTGDVDAVDPTGAGYDLAAGRNATVNAQGAIRIGNLTATSGAAGVSGGVVDAGDVTAGTDLTATAGAGDLTLASLQAGGGISLTTTKSATAISIGSATAGGNLTANSAADLTVSSLATAGGALSLRAGGTITTDDLTAKNGSVSVVGALTYASTITASGNVLVSASIDPSLPALIVRHIVSGGDVTLSSPKGDSVVGSVAMTGGGTFTDTANANDTAYLGLVKTAGNYTDGQYASGGQITGAATAAVQAGAIDAALSGDAAFTSLTAATGAIDVTADTVHIATLNAATNASVSATSGVASVAGATTAGDLSISGASLALGQAAAGGALQLSATGGDIAATGRLSGASVNATATGALQLADVASSNGVTLNGTGVSTGAVTAGGEVTVSGGPGAVTLAAINTPSGASLNGGGVTLGAAGLGGDLVLVSTGDASLGAVTAGGGLSLDAAGLASIGSVSVSGMGRVTAGDVDIATLLSAPNLTIEARNGALTVGGATAPTTPQMWISEDEFSRIHAADSLSLYAGAAAGTARGALVVSNLSLDPAVVPVVSFYAGAGQTASVTGAVAPTASGGVVDIGSATDAAWRPSTILVSGSLGTATRVNDQTFTGVQAFNQVNLNSAGDVLIGSPRFFALVQATPASKLDISTSKPAGVTATGSEVGEIYVAAGQLNIAATGKVVQQNSSGSATAYSGLYLLNGVSTTGNALTLDPPSVVDLFGSYVNSSGVLVSGIEASRGTGLAVYGLAAGASTPDDYRFNGCEIAPTAVCGVSVGPEQGFQVMLEEQEFAGVAAATTDPQLLTQSVLLTVAPSVQIEDQMDPLVTGVGNEEIWRKRSPDEGSDR